MIDPQRFWSRDDDAPAGAGLSRTQIQDCASRFGVRFPDTYVELLTVRNGGGVRDEDLELLPLPSVVAPGDFGVVATAENIAGEDEFARDLIEDELGEARLVLLIAGDDGHTYHALDFNANGPFGEPRVVWLDFECGDCSEVSPSFAAFVKRLMRSDDDCAVDLREIERLDVVARETIDYSHLGGPRIEQHLCDAGDALVLFLDSNGPQGHELSRVEVPRPVNADACVIMPVGPKPDQTFMLMLQPQEDDAILWTTSRETADGRWKNERSRGVPIYSHFQSAQRSRLEELRTDLLGGVVSERAAAEEQWQEQIEGMSEEELESAFPHMMLEMMGGVEDLMGELDAEDVPDELKSAMQHVERLRDRMKADLEQRAADSEPPSDELLDLMRQIMPKPEDFHFDE